MLTESLYKTDFLRVACGQELGLTDDLVHENIRRDEHDHRFSSLSEGDASESQLMTYGNCTRWLIFASKRLWDCVPPALKDHLAGWVIVRCLIMSVEHLSLNRKSLVLQTPDQKYNWQLTDNVLLISFTRRESFSCIKRTLTCVLHYVNNHYHSDFFILSIFVFIYSYLFYLLT